MTLRITSIADVGNPRKERVAMKVASTSTDIGEYAMFRARDDNDSVSTEVTDVFWFPDHKLKPGDFVVLYTKSGSDKTRRNKDDSASHFFYWGIDKPIWSQSDCSAVLLHVDHWHSRKPLED